MRYLLLGIAIGLCAACGGKSHDSRFAGRWTGMVYDGSADPVDIQVRDSGAFDGNPPDRLVDETTDALDRCLEKMKRLQSVMQSFGVSSVVVLSSHDPLTDMNHVAFSSRGNLYQNMGAVHKYLASTRDAE